MFAWTAITTRDIEGLSILGFFVLPSGRIRTIPVRSPIHGVYDGICEGVFLVQGLK